MKVGVLTFFSSKNDSAPTLLYSKYCTAPKRIANTTILIYAHSLSELFSPNFKNSVHIPLKCTLTGLVFLEKLHCNVSRHNLKFAHKKYKSPALVVQPEHVQVMHEKIKSFYASVQPEQTIQLICTN